MDIFGISLQNLKKDELLANILSFREQNRVFTPNPEILLKARVDTEFQGILKQATFLTSDGIGLYIAFQILDSKLPLVFNVFSFPYYILNLFFRRKYLYAKYGERICGSDLTKDILARAEKQNIPIIISDLYNPTDEKKVYSQTILKDKIKEVYPNLEVNFFIWNPEKKDEVLNQMSQSKAKIIFSTLGMKTQEQNVIEIMNACPNIMLGLGVGSSFDSITGLQKRAPVLWRKSGFEWLYRLITGPQKVKRLKRLYNAIFVFTYFVYKEKGDKGTR